MSKEDLDQNLDVDVPGEDDDVMFGSPDDLLDPVQAFGQLFIVQHEDGATETFAEILADLRDELSTGVKVLHKISKLLDVLAKKK